MNAHDEERVLAHEMPEPGAVLSRRYRLERVLGRGATAVVYQAFDTLLEELVALKVLIVHRAVSEAMPSNLPGNLRAEARAAMRLSHTNILRISNFEQDGPFEYLVMEFVPGADCRAMRKRFPEGCFPVELAGRIVLQALAGIQCAHDANLFHHDLKPSNLLIASRDPLLVKVGDFGLGALAIVNTHGTNWLAGTPAFMAPERISGEAGGVRSDLYSMAATLYALANGAAPFGSEMPSVLWRHLSSPLPASSKLPPALHAVVQRAMEKSPSHRYGSALEMAAAIEEAMGLDTADSGSWSRRWPTMRPSTDGAFASSGAFEDSGERIRPESLQEISVAIEVVAPSPLPEPPRPPPLPIKRPESMRVPSPPRRPSPPAEGMRRIECSALLSAYDVSGVPVTVAPFLLDEIPVTNERYERFIAATAALPPSHWVGMRGPKGEGDHPVVGVTLADAIAFARWEGKRLPTAVEWEAAARRPDGRDFPWGEWRQGCANGPSLERGGTTPVRAFPEGASVDGCLDLIGNVWEWTDPDNHDAAEFTWAFGGSFRHEGRAQGRIARVEVSVASAFLYLGFRCARDIE